MKTQTTQRGTCSGEARGTRARSILFAFPVALALAALPACDRTSGESEASKSATTKPEPHSAAGADEHGHKGEGHSEAAGGAKDEHGHGEGHADEVKLTSEAIRANGIRIDTAGKKALVATILAPARVAYNAEQVAHVGSVVRGRVVDLKARVGDNVKKGDVLLVMDSPELGETQSDFLQKRTVAQIAEPAVGLAKSAYERAQQLYDKSQGIALTDVQKRQGEYQAAQGNLAAAKASLTAAENRLHLLGMDQAAVEELARTGEISPKHAVRAPLAGRVIEREVTLGELVAPEKEKLMVIADMSSVWVLADVPEAKLGQLSTGAKAEIAVPALGSQKFEGTISYLSPELDPSTRTARVRVEVKNPDMKLLPGMFAQAQLAAGSTGEGGASEPVVTVPEDAVQTVEGEPAVFVPVDGEPNTFAKRQVGVGQPVGGLVPVFAGLKEGEKYVSAGSFILKAEIGKAGAAHEH